MRKVMVPMTERWREGKRDESAERPQIVAGREREESEEKVRTMLSDGAQGA